MNIKSMLIFVVILMVGCSSAPASPTEPTVVTVQLKWVHQAQFAGYYIADELGFFAEENIQVEFLPGGVGVDHFESLNSGSADFAIVRPEGIFFERRQGNRIIAFATIFQVNPFLLVAKSDSGILTPLDFPGKTIALDESSKTQFFSMLRNLDLEPNEIDFVPFIYNYDSFYNGEIDVMPAFAAGSLLDIRRDGISLNYIWPDDYGVHWYSDTLATTEDFAENHPDIVEGFLRAVIKGHAYTLENPEEAAEASLRYADVQDYETQLGMVKASIPMIYTGDEHIGWMSVNVWEQMQQDLIEFSELDQEVPMNQIFTMQFLELIYEGSQ
jgi:NitT/TauT family transport system substrate-binding protein